MSKEITESTFNTDVIQSDIPVLVDFWAPWCGPCRMLSSTIDGLAEKLEGKVKVCKVNVDDCPNIAVQYQISSVPTVMLFNKGDSIQTLVGLQPEEAYLKAVDSVNS